LEQGKLAFLQLFEGRLTGAVFLGRGHILTAPRDPVEKQQMAHFLGAPVLDQDFSSACLRFTDATAADLLRQLREAGISPQPDSAFAARWDPLLAKLNPSQALRVLFDSLSQTPKPYFYGAIDGVTTGPFDVVLDPLRRESLLLGQTKMNADRTFYDVWASYKPPDISAPALLCTLCATRLTLPSWSTIHSKRKRKCVFVPKPAANACSPCSSRTC